MNCKALQCLGTKLSSPTTQKAATGLAAAAASLTVLAAGAFLTHRYLRKPTKAPVDTAEAPKLLQILPPEPCLFHLHIEDNTGTLSWFPQTKPGSIFHRFKRPELHTQTILPVEIGEILRWAKENFAPLPKPTKQILIETNRPWGKESVDINLHETEEATEFWGKKTQSPQK
jgi:hypothetical protein